MAISSKAAVTPSGIRDGEPAALAALVERRANAVLAYGEAILPRALADRAAAEAFARFRAAVATSSDPRALDPEGLLLRATRHAAASFTPIPPPPAPSGGLRRLGHRGAQSGAEVCAQVPDLLVARAEGVLGDADRERLTRHLERHPACQALATAAAAGEAAFAAPPARTVPIGALTEIMLALTAAAPITASRGQTLNFQAVVEEPEDVLAGTSQAAAATEAEAEAVAPPGPVAEADPEPSSELLADVEPVTEEESVAVAAPLAAPEDEEAAALTDEHATVPVAPARAVAAGGVAHPRPARRHLHLPGADHGLLYRFVLPAGVVAAGAVAAMGAAGVFDGEPATRDAGALTAPPSNSPPVTSSTTAQAAAAKAAATERRRARAAAAAARRRARARATARAKARAAARARALQAPATGATGAAPAAVAPATAPPAAAPTRSSSGGASTASTSSSHSSSSLPGDGSSGTDPSGDPGVFQGTP